MKVKNNNPSDTAPAELNPVAKNKLTDEQSAIIDSDGNTTIFDRGKISENISNDNSGT